MVFVVIHAVNTTILVARLVIFLVTIFDIMIHETHLANLLLSDKFLALAHH